MLAYTNENFKNWISLSGSLVIVCCVLIQEKVRRSPKGFVRNGNEREGGGGGGCRITRDELENELAGRSTLNQRRKCADLPSSWRLTSTRTHSLPRTLVFRGFTSHQLVSRSLTLGPLADTAFMTQSLRTVEKSRDFGCCRKFGRVH